MLFLAFAAERLNRWADMASQTLYAYVDGADLDDVEELLEREILAFVADRRWSRTTWFVNQRHPRDPSDNEDDLPLWDLGINHELPDRHTEQDGWFREIEDIARFLGALAAQSGRAFVIGVGHDDTGVTDDLFLIENGDIDHFATAGDHWSRASRD